MQKYPKQMKNAAQAIIRVRITKDTGLAAVLAGRNRI